MSTTGYPAMIPFFMQSRTPFSTEGMKLRGTAPPKTSSTNSKPPPRWSGSTRSQVSPYWPRPPVCFLYLPCPSARPLTVSLYGLRGGSKDNGDVNLLPPRIPYKETVKGRAEGQGKYKKQTGGRGQYGDVWLRAEPLPRGGGFEFVDDIFGGAVPRNYIPSVEKGVRDCMKKGIIAGYPVVDLKVTLYDGTYHEVDSSDMAFQIAASLGLQKVFMEAHPILLEPIMNVEVTCPSDVAGDIIGDLNSRRGRIVGMEPAGETAMVRAQAPMAEMLTYEPSLRSMTGGRGGYSMEFSHYEEVPAFLAEKVIKEVKTEKEKQTH